MHSKPGAHMWKLHQLGSPACSAQRLTPAVVRARHGHVPVMIAACAGERRTARSRASDRNLAGDVIFCVGGSFAVAIGRI